MAVENNIDVITHPQYDREIIDWEKFAFVMEGGSLFIDEFLEKFSVRESDEDFQNRKKVTYAPAHAKSLVNEVKNAIFQRMVDIVRSGGPKSYQTAIKGEDGGVNFQSDSMNSFIGNEVTPLLLAFRKVGVFVDKPQQLMIPTMVRSRFDRPYLYTYSAADIRSWKYDDQNNLTHLLLRDHIDVIDEKTGLVTDFQERYRFLQLTSEGVVVRFFDDSGNAIAPVLDLPELTEAAPLSEGAILLKIPEIPFVIGEITDSLLQDIADIQIALLNLASSDMNYALKSNFPFYTEQYTPQAEIGNLHRQATPTGEAGEAAKANSPEIKTGGQQGRRYPRGADRPGFINPSPEPLKVSMEKQNQLKEEMRQIINVSLNSIRSRSAESKKEDERGKEEGLSAIGVELETMERHIARIWNLYETKGRGDAVTISYPVNYSIKSDEERIKEADDLTDQIPKTPSLTLKKELSKQSAETLVGHKVDSDKMATIKKEIDSAVVIATDPEVIRMDAEAGFVGVDTASKARGYPDGETEKAKVDHADRASRIALAQAKANQRGVADMDEDPNVVKDARKGESDPTTNPTSADPTRGKGQ